MWIWYGKSPRERQCHTGHGSKGCVAGDRSSLLPLVQFFFVWVWGVSRKKQQRRPSIKMQDNSRGSESEQGTTRKVRKRVRREALGTWGEGRVDGNGKRAQVGLFSYGFIAHTLRTRCQCGDKTLQGDESRLSGWCLLCAILGFD